MSIENKLATLRNRMKTAGGKKGATVKVGDTGFQATIDALPAERSPEAIVKAAELLGMKTQFRGEVKDGVTLTEKAAFLPGKEAFEMMTDVLKDEELFTDPPAPGKGKGKGEKSPGI